MDHDHLGISTLTWWDGIHSELNGATTTTPFYTRFRKMVQTDLRGSTRLDANGLTDIFLDVAKHCFKGHHSLPPTRSRATIAALHHKDHATTNTTKRGH